MTNPERSSPRNLELGDDLEDDLGSRDSGEILIVVGIFTAIPGSESSLAGVLSRYTVLTRGNPGCRNVDLAASLIEPGRFVLIEKWADESAQRLHADSNEMVAMAEDALPLLQSAPVLDLTLGISAHDLI
jgi:quinol monooxygenase YgiN